MRASDVFKPPQLSFQQRSHHYEFWVPQLVGGQKSRSRHTFLVKKKKLADEAASSLKHTIASTTVAVSHGRCDVFQGSGIKTVKKEAAQEKYSKVSTNTAKCQQKLQCIRLRLRRDDKSAKQTSSWTKRRKKNLGCGCSSPVKIMPIISSTKDKRWLTKDQQLFFF